MKVCEIFKSIEGEGIRTGLPAVFVRLHGCNLRCSYCDSLYAVEGNDWRQMDVGEVTAAVEAFGLTRVTLTGGEPLIHPGSEQLLNLLSGSGYEVNVETNGTVPCGTRHPGIFYTMDWKCPASGMSSAMKFQNIESLNERDVLKFVVGTREDLEEAEQVVGRLAAAKAKREMPHIFLSPVFGWMESEKIVAWMLSSKIMTENNARFQVQLHKVVWDPDRRGV